MGIGMTSPILDIVVDAFGVTILIPPLTCAGRDHLLLRHGVSRREQRPMIDSSALAPGSGRC